MTVGMAQELSTEPSLAKRRILDAAAKLFRARGFARATVRELADAVGILSGSLFHHFASKDDILFTVMAEIVADMDRSLAAALERALTCEDRVRALVHNQLTYIHGPKSDAAAVLVYEWSALSKDRQARLNEGRKRYFRRWQTVLEEAEAQDLITVRPDVLRKLVHGATVWSANWYDAGGAVTLAELEDAVLSMILVKKSGNHAG